MSKPTSLNHPALAARIGCAVLAIGAAFLLASCGGNESPADAGGGPTTSDSRSPRLEVAATTTQVGDIVRSIGGDAIELNQLLAPNTDPHNYDPRPRDVAAVADAKIIFQSGSGLDAWAADVVENAGGNPTTVTLADASVTPLPGEDHDPHEDEHGGAAHSHEEAHADDNDEKAEHDHAPSELDPHWWHDPRNVAAAIPLVQEALTTANPDARHTYAANAAAYVRKVRILDAGIARCLESVPAAERKLVTDHDAFGYFARRYGIRVVGAILPSQTTAAQPSAGDLADLAETIRRERVRAIFPETSVSPRLAQAIARATGASAERTLYGDTLGPRGSSGASYLTMMEANADAVTRGLTGNRRGCTIPGID